VEIEASLSVGSVVPNTAAEITICYRPRRVSDRSCLCIEVLDAFRVIGGRRRAQPVVQALALAQWCGGFHLSVLRLPGDADGCSPLVIASFEGMV
jgi:hypothetical protein